MKRLTLLSLALAATSLHATTIWDTVYSDASQTALRSGTSAGSSASANGLVGQTFKISAPGAYSIDTLGFSVYNSSSSTLSDSTFTVTLFDAINAAAFNTSANPFGTSILYTYTGKLGLGTLSGSGLASRSYGVATLSGISGVTIDDTKAYGVVISSADPTAVIPLITYGNPVYTAASGYTGGGGWYYDKDGNGTLIGTEWGYFPRQANNQLGFSASGVQVVPEPTTMAVFGLGLVAVAARRRKNS